MRNTSRALCLWLAVALALFGMLAAPQARPLFSTAGSAPLIFWGDSLTAGTGSTSTATSYTFLVSTGGARGRWYWQGGVGGQTSVQIAARQGAVPATATVSGGQIPTSGGVTVTFVAGTEPLTSQGPAIGVYGSISGVSGRLTLVSTTYTFTRLATGSVVNVSSAPFVPDISFQPVNATQILWVGRNDATNSAVVQSNIAAMAALTRNYLVLSVLTASNDSAGTITQINALNSALAATYGARFVNVLATLVALGGPGQPYADPTAFAAGYPPGGLRFDNIHLDDAGYAVVAAQVSPIVIANGW